MKKNLDGTNRTRINARLFDQEDGDHYTKYDVSAPVANGITIHIVFILIIMAAWWV